MFEQLTKFLNVQYSIFNEVTIFKRKLIHKKLHVARFNDLFITVNNLVHFHRNLRTLHILLLRTSRNMEKQTYENVLILCFSIEFTVQWICDRPLSFIYLENFHLHKLCHYYEPLSVVYELYFDLTAINF